MKKILCGLMMVFLPVFAYASCPAGITCFELSNTGQNVGIGSPNPSQVLDVNGTVKGSDFKGPGTSLTGTAAALNVGGSAGSVTTAAQPAITSLGTLTGLNVSGNVGVNSATPGAAVDVVGGVRATTFTGDGSALTGIAESVSGQTTNYFPVASNSTTFIPSTINQVGGNVGIGGATPGQTLDIQGTLRATTLYGDGSNLTGIGGSISGLTTGTFTKAASSTTIASSANMTEVGANVGISTATPGQKFDVQGTIRGTTLMAGSGSALITGVGANVGIGSASPGGRLDLGTGTLCLNHTCSSTFLSSQWNTAGSNVYFTGGNVGIGTSAPALSFDVEGGNVGIGTWVPSPFQSLPRLLVQENANAGILVKGLLANNGGNADFGVETSDAAGSWSLAAVQSAGGGIIAGAFTIYDAVNDKNPFFLEPGTPSNTFVMKASGNVGIGSANPGQVLDVNGTLARFKSPNGTHWNCGPNNSGTWGCS